MIDRARSGDQAELARLLAQFRDVLREALQRERPIGAGSETGASRLLELTLATASSEFGRFTGSSHAELSGWLLDILRREVSGDGMSDGVTLVRDEQREPTLHRPEGPLEHFPSLAPVSGSPATTNLPPGLRAAGQEFGDYDLLQPIAKGGMGVVYKARQRKLNRIVAIKMILTGQFADQVEVDRFYAEAEAAANLRHPNIVTIHEVGQHQGQHFFSMDYIDGQSLYDLVRENPLSGRDAARYVKTISLAIQFAHQHGILHRDLKPSNVLLDANNEPLITDFGLAKQVAGQSQLTVSGAVVGTPSYMPPEQAAGRGEAVSVRSDVYSIGAILYELVTGRPPFRAANPFETIKQVLELEPISPRLLNPGVPADLETITLKCLQKEPARRYSTAQDLADELTRFLNGEPILARPISRIERGWRWCRRNPTVASLLGFLALCVAALFLAITIGYVRTESARRETEAMYQQARAAVDDLFVEVSENTLLNEHGMQPLRKKLLQLALDYYQRFLDQRGAGARIDDELALTYFRVGLITEKIESREKALDAYLIARRMQQALVDQRPDDIDRLDALGTTLNAIGVARQQLKQPEALQNYRDAVAIRQRVVDLAPGQSELQRRLANGYMNIGLYQKDQGDYASALRELDQAQLVRQEILATDPQARLVERDLARGYFNLGDLARVERNAGAESRDAEASAASFQKAISNFQQAAAIFEKLLQQDPQDLDNRYRLALCYRLLADERLQGASLGKNVVVTPDPEKARELYEQARERMAPLAYRNPDVQDYQAELAGLHFNIAKLNLARDPPQVALAMQSFGQAKQILESLVRNHPDTPRYRRDLAMTFKEIGSEQFVAGDWREAFDSLAASRRLLETLVRQFPGDQRYAAALADTVGIIQTLEENRDR